MVEMRLVTAGGTVDTTSLPDRRWELYGKTVHDCDGNPVGIVAAIYVDDDTDRPMWAAVRRPSLNGPAPLVPLCRATVASDGRLDVPLPAAILLVAPAVGDTDAELDLAFEDALFAHYASAFSSPPGPAGRRNPAPEWSARCGPIRLRRCPAERAARSRHHPGSTPRAFASPLDAPRSGAPPRVVR